MDQKRILIVNDDGIDSPGLEALARALGEKAEVYVCAPDRQRSASGHSITMRKPISLKEHDLTFARKAYVCSGTPSDCVKIGLWHMEKTQGTHIDYVFSGINLGHNLGTDTLYSGTVAAALDGAMEGKPSAALSVDSRTPKHYEFACELALEALDRLRDFENRPVTLNINVPDLPKEKIPGLIVARLGIKGYDNALSPEKSAEGEFVYYLGGTPTVYKSKNTAIDVIAGQEDYATITPLMFDLTDHGAINALKDWEWRK